MFKRLFMTLGFLAVVSAPSFSMTADFLTAFNGQTGSGIFYFPAGNNNRLIAGAGLSLPSSDRSGWYGLVGIENLVPILGGLDVEVFFIQTSPTDQGSTLYDSDSFRFFSTTLIKKWLFPLTQDIQVGFKIVVLAVDYDLDAKTTSLSVLDGAWPVVGATVQF